MVKAREQIQRWEVRTLDSDYELEGIPTAYLTKSLNRSRRTNPSQERLIMDDYVSKQVTLEGN